MSIFILGASGYIGGSVLVGLKRTFAMHDYVALVRSEKNIPAIEALGVTVIQGSHRDLDIVSEQASKASIIVNCADADDLELTKAIISGAKNTTQKQTPILIHTSGTGLVVGESTGKFDPEAKVYNDNNVDDILSIPPTAPHRKVDLAIFDAEAAGTVSAYIIAPSTIYGTGTGPCNKLSQQIPELIRQCIIHKQAIYVGDGTNEWNNVHIADLVDLYLLVANLAASDLRAAKVDPHVKFFWGSVGRHAWGDVSREIGKLLYKKGVIETEEAKSIPLVPELLYVSNNSLTVADRAMRIGWQPHHPSLWETLPETVDQVVAETKSS